MSEEKDSTKWKFWYWGLIIVLALQIALYLWITNIYSS